MYIGIIWIFIFKKPHLSLTFTNRKTPSPPFVQTGSELGISFILFYDKVEKGVCLWWEEKWISYIRVSYWTPFPAYNFSSIKCIIVILFKKIFLLFFNLKLSIFILLHYDHIYVRIIIFIINIFFNNRNFHYSSTKKNRKIIIVGLLYLNLVFLIVLIEKKKFNHFK